MMSLLLSLLKELLICPKKERIELDISPALLKQAKHGDSYAQLEIASRYFSINKKQYVKKSIYWFKRAAENNNKEAMFVLGTLYLKGKNVQPDFQQAVTWYKRAASLGHRKSIKMLVRLMKAILQQKTLQNDSNAMCQLANYCTSGDLGFTDYETAKILYQKSADLGNTDALTSLTSLCKKELEINAAIDSTNSLNHQRHTKILVSQKLEQLAIEASTGNRNAIKAYTNLCILHQIKIDYEMLIQWLYKSAEKGNSDAMVDIGNFYTYGTPPLNQDYQQAIHWLTKASDLANDKAMNLLGLIYLDGHGVIVNKEIAISWFKKSAHLGNDKAMVNIASLYLENTPTDINYQQAYQWLLPAAQKDNLQAIQLIINLYKNGLGVEKDLDQIKYWEQQLLLKNKTTQ